MKNYIEEQKVVLEKHDEKSRYERMNQSRVEEYSKFTPSVS